MHPCQLRTLRSVKVSYIACGDEYSVFLTKDGGVFTCGSGSYGQLGHGNTSNEILPKKVIGLFCACAVVVLTNAHAIQVTELMGSTITQVTCGRRHTLAFVPSRGRVYSFGLGGSGQLGGRTTRNSTTPQIVLGPWVSPSGIPALESKEASCIIKRIFAGGDHCFVTVSPEKAHEASYDCRIESNDAQILKLTIDQLNLCVNVSSNSNVDPDLWAYLENVFKSLACINGSFLMPNEEHYCCTSKRHGIDIDAAELAFSTIGKIENDSMRGLVKCLCSSIFIKLFMDVL